MIETGSSQAVIRPARVKDSNRIYAIGVSHSDFAVSPRIRFYEKSEVETWARKRGDNVFLIAERANKILGFIYCKVMSHHWAMIDNYFVLPECRKEGTGARLLEECLGKLRTRGISYVSAMVKSADEELRNYMKKRGFQETSEYVWVEKFL